MAAPASPEQQTALPAAPRTGSRSARRTPTMIGLQLSAVVFLCGMAGMAIGIAVAYRATEARVGRYATNLVNYADAYSDEIQSTLDEVNRSPFPFCSDEDIDRLRNLVFSGHLVKEIGRVRDGRLYCTSTGGRLDPPITINEPDIVTVNGRSVKLHAALTSVPGMIGDITYSGEADFVADSETFSYLGEPPMRYSTLLTNRAANRVLRTGGDPVKLSNSDIFAERSRWKSGVLYTARCSRRFAPCMIASISLEAAWRQNDSMIGGFLLIGALAGITLGSTVVLRPRRRNLATQLLRALRLNLITVVYQPIVDIQTGRMIGAEALARWTNEDGQYVRPDVFVAAAEELGFIGKLTRSVLRLVLTELGDLLRSRPGFHVSVNIAAGDLADPEFLATLQSMLEKYQVAPQSIALELTERSTADHELAISAIGRLRSRGHLFYIDDFGTGYSSLAYLNDLKVDAIKIDRAFTDAIGTDSLTAAIVPQILAMAAALHVGVVVEGVERENQSSYFAALDHTRQTILAQGWHFGEPLHAEGLIALLNAKEPLAPVSTAS